MVTALTITIWNLLTIWKVSKKEIYLQELQDNEVAWFWFIRKSDVRRSFAALASSILRSVCVNLGIQIVFGIPNKKVF